MTEKRKFIKQLKRAAPVIVFSFTGIIMAVYAVSLIYPIVWVLFSSLKDTYDYTLRPFSLPDIWFFENYARKIVQ